MVRPRLRMVCRWSAIAICRSGRRYWAVREVDIRAQPHRPHARARRVADGRHGVAPMQMSTDADPATRAGMPGFRPTPQSSNLVGMQETPPAACMKVVSSYVQPSGGHQLDRGSLAAFHAKRALWSAPGHLQSKVRVLHFTVLTSITRTNLGNSYTPGTHDETSGQLAATRDRDISGLHVPDESSGGTRLEGCSHLAMGSGDRCRLVALGHVKVVAWKDAWRRHTIHDMHHTDADPGKMRLSRTPHARKAMEARSNPE